ncbi:MAG: hypothetical protein AAFX78_03180 [Cyanobacteria bacterium J06638_20]
MAVSFSSSLALKWGMVAAIAATSVACSDNRAAQCNRLTEVANKTVGEVQTIVSGNDQPDGAALRQVAASFDSGRAEMEALLFSDEQLQGYQARFIQLYEEVSVSAQQLSDALNSQDFDSAQTARDQFQASTEKEEPLVREVNDYCAAIAPTAEN